MPLPMMSCMSTQVNMATLAGVLVCLCPGSIVGRGEGTVGNPHRAQISQVELFELSPLSKLGN